MKTQNDPISSLNGDLQAEDLLTPTGQAMNYDIGPDSRSERMSNAAVKGMAWLLGIVGVFALAILIAWACNINRSPLDAYMSSSTAALRQPVVTVPNSVKSTSATPLTASLNTQNTSKNMATPAANKAAAVTTATTDSQAGQLAPADQDRIEKEAQEVLHGDYGNNPMRAKKLGADYALVQARVNQILHS